MTPSVIIQGDGIAARCCERLFALEPGWRVIRQGARRSRLPAIMIGEGTQQMFGDVFGREDLFRDLHPILRRKVAWGEGSELHVLPHRAVVADEAKLLERLENTHEPGEEQDASGAWTIAASKPFPGETEERHFGSRAAHAVPVQLRDGADANACLIESVPDGWLFLVPYCSDAAWLLAVGSDAETLLGESRFTAREVARLNSAGSRFASHPRVAWPLCSDGWLACGTGALAFDPLCGDGSGNAIREAILASAVVRALQPGESAVALLRHYRTRLLAGFQRHLEVCAGFYQNGGTSSWWMTQLQDVETGLAWCREQLGPKLKFEFRLNGFALERVRGY